MAKYDLNRDERLVLVAVRALAEREAASIHAIESYLDGPNGVAVDALHGHLSSLFDKGFVCKSYDNSHFSITPRARCYLEEQVLRPRAD